MSESQKVEKPFLSIHDLRKSFRHQGKQIDVLMGIDLEVSDGEMLSVAGASGVGKSTFLHIVGTLDTPTKGKVYYDGLDVMGLKDSALADFRNRNIGFVFQFHYLLPEFTALENTMMPALINRMPRAAAHRDARELLDAVGLSHRLNHKPGELSGGEQQRVALARALAMKPRLLLADEPTGNLDERSSEEIHQLLVNLNEQYSTTVIVVTHNHALANQMPRRLYMKDGLIHESQ